jgi:hypothetical protein
MPVAQLHPVNEADSRFFKRHRSCWKRGLWSARFTNAYCRRPSAPPRKVTKDPLQCGGQAVPVPMSVFSRHVSIMRLLSLSYEQYDGRLCCLARSLMAVLTSADAWRGSTSTLGVSPRLNPSRRVSCTNPCTISPLTCGFSNPPICTSSVSTSADRDQPDRDPSISISVSNRPRVRAAVGAPIPVGSTSGILGVFTPL